MFNSDQTELKNRPSAMNNTVIQIKKKNFLNVMLEKTLASPWTARSNQSILKEINSEYSLEGLMLKLKFQYYDRLIMKN